MSNLNNLSIGTAQFGMLYGLTNKKKIKLCEIKKIFDICLRHNITNFDTAYAYKESERIIGKYIFPNIKISSKLPRITLNPNTVHEHVNNFLMKSLLRLNVNKIDSYFIHSPDQLLSSNGDLIYEALRMQKKNNLIDNIGISVYEVDELNQLLHYFDFDVVQLPYNFFNTTFEDQGVLLDLKKRKIKVHLRSIFMQGLLLMPLNKIPPYFKRWAPVFKDWENYQKKSKLSALELCLLKAFALDSIDKVIIGINSHHHLVDIISALSNKDFQTSTKIDFSVDSLPEDLINPSKWIL